MSTPTPPAGDPATPPIKDPKKKPEGKPDPQLYQDWNIIITDEGKVQMEKEDMNKLLNVLNTQVTMHDSFVKKTMAKDKLTMIEELSKSMEDPTKKLEYQKFLMDKQNQDLELLISERRFLGGEPPQTSTTTTTPDQPQTPPPSTHNQTESDTMAGRHAPTGLKNKEENTYYCSGCSKSHKLEDFY